MFALFIDTLAISSYHLSYKRHSPLATESAVYLAIFSEKAFLLASCSVASLSMYLAIFSEKAFLLESCSVASLSK